MSTETKTVNATGMELADVLTEHLADGWRLIGQSTLGASEYELHFVRGQEGQA